LPFLVEEVKQSVKIIGGIIMAEFNYTAKDFKSSPKYVGAQAVATMPS
jgi:hypothetical protein